MAVHYLSVTLGQDHLALITKTKKNKIMIRFSYTILYVRDVIKSIEFYEKAFGFQRKFIAPGNEYAELTTGDTILSFAATSLAKTNLSEGFIESCPTGKPFGIEIGFTTTDVEKVFNESIQAGAIAVEKAKIKPWGQTVAYVKDPDGFLIEICTPMS
jgi:lactoylglutathione lyase